MYVYIHVYVTCSNKMSRMSKQNIPVYIIYVTRHAKTRLL